MGCRSGHLSIFLVADVRELFGDDAHIRSIKVGLSGSWVKLKSSKAKTFNINTPSYDDISAIMVGILLVYRIPAQVSLS